MHLARRLWSLLEPIHVVSYFSPEPLGELKAAGYKGYWMGYFAQRGAALGEASPELVEALFYNFSRSHIARALPDAWTFASPRAALDARLRGSSAALARHTATAGIATTDLARAAELASRAAAAAPVEGRGLFAAHRGLPEPEEPLARLWHAATLLREHRGDGHVAALLAHGIGGRESHVFHAVRHGMPAEAYVATRNLDAQEWAGHLEALRLRALVDREGALTDQGLALKQAIEDLTDELAAPAYAVLTDTEARELRDLLAPVSAAVVASGELPLPLPTGLDPRTAQA